MKSLQFAVIDVETTGLFARGCDRVIEVAVVVVDDHGNLRDEYATLVNPGRDLGPTSIHGIRGRDVAEAPTFAEIAGDLSERLCGRVLVAHNARFDHGFLAAEFSRSGFSFPDAPWLCTMELGRASTGLGGLKSCCDGMGISLARWHCARDDAEAAAAILDWCLRLGDANRALEEALLKNPIPASTAWPQLTPSRRSVRRSTGRPHRRSTYISTLLANLPTETPLTDSAALAYLEVLDRALEDRKLTTTEVDALHDLASSWGISAHDLIELHDRYLRRLTGEAWRDGVVTEAERADLEDVAVALGTPPAVLEELLVAPFVNGAPPYVPHTTPASLKGLSVCFTGQLTCTLEAEQITREHARELASTRGVIVLEGVTKKLDLLVVADPDSLSGKAKKARGYGTRIIVERAFWRELGVNID
jgi:DNA polymerase-3 subunit epsilon